MITSIQDNDKCKNKSSRTQNDTFTKIISFIQLRIKFNTNLFQNIADPQRERERVSNINSTFSVHISAEFLFDKFQ